MFDLSKDKVSAKDIYDYGLSKIRKELISKQKDLKNELIKIQKWMITLQELEQLKTEDNYEIN